MGWRFARIWGFGIGLILAGGAIAWANGGAAAPDAPEGWVALGQPYPIHARGTEVDVVGLVSNVPLPQGVAFAPELTHVRLGSSTVTVQGFSSPLTSETLREFYLQALPAFGWEVTALPWQASVLLRAARLEEALSREVEPLAHEAALRHALETALTTSESMSRQLYAVRGRDHVIVNLLPMAHGTAAFLNRWVGDAFWNDASEVSKAGAPSNVCCSTESVPGTEAGLPFGIPRYPGGRVVAQSGPASGDFMAFLLLTVDVPSKVQTYFEDVMPKAGWQPVALSFGVSSRSSKRVSVGFERAGWRCLILAEGSRAEGTASRTAVVVEVFKQR